jgi:uncharacterized protein YbjQ (UPF0145 family)
MIVVTTENIAGHRTVQTLGQCFGVVVRSRGLGGNIMASLRTIVGGEIHEYTRLLEEARRHALDRLVENATAMGANAILMMRYDSAEIGQTMSEIVAYGHAAVIDPYDDRVRLARRLRSCAASDLVLFPQGRLQAAPSRRSAWT